MLIQYRQQYFDYFLTLIFVLLCHTENLFCIEFNTQKNSFTDNHADSFYHLYNITDKTTNKDHHHSVPNSEKRQMVNASKSGGSSPWSNAFNFQKVWGTHVDPRTGILSAYVKTGSMLSNLGHGPNINLIAGYSSSTLANPDGLGTGWRWNLTHFNPVTHQLTTSFGQNFYLRKQPDGHWWPLYHKFHDMRIQGDIHTCFVITYANGLRETLNHEGYEVRLEQQDGWDVYFSYIPGTHLLQSVRDDEGHSITLHRTKDSILVISLGSLGKSVVVLIHKKNNELHSITLPPFNYHKGPGIYFHYVQHFITGVDYPTGLKNRVIYNCSDEIKIPINDIALPHALCAVVKETVDPGCGEPVMVNHYQYGKTNSNEHNYLGFNAGLHITSGTSKDRLFEAPASYTYLTTQDNGLIQEIRTYNKYHLMTDDQQISDRTGHVLSAAHYFFCRTDQRDGCAYTSFIDLPVAYSLPLKIVTEVWGDTVDRPAVTTVTARYDSQGRVIHQTDVYGRITVNHYCPLTGDTACPAASTAWPFATLTEFTTLYPSATGINTTSLSPITTYNYYRKVINLNRKGYISVLDHQIQQAGKQQLTTIRYYYNNPDDRLTYGLLKQVVLTDQQNKTASPDAIIKDYYYIKSPDNFTKTTYSAIELSHNKRQLSSYITTSLFTNQVLKATDAGKKYTTRYYYDQWDRLIKKERAVGTAFAASIHYDYTTSKNFNQVLITAVNGLQEKVIFDNAGRALTSFTEAIDKTGKQQPGHWWPMQKTRYDQYGRIAQQSSYSIDQFGYAKPLHTTQDYDDTGRVIRVHLPDGGTAVTRYDDSDRCVISYQQNAQGERSVISVSRANILSQPIKQWILPASTDPLPSVKSLCLNSDQQPEARVSMITYDGFGRPITTRDAVGRVLRQFYDSLGRLTDTIDPAGNRVHQVYNLTGQVIQSWVHPVSGGDYLLSSAGYNTAGQLRWRAGEDGKRTFYTYTQDGQIATITTPDRHIFSWKYNIFNLPVNESIDNKQQWTIYYNPITLGVYKKTDITGTTTYAYSDDGLTQQSAYTGKNSYSDYKLQWQYDNNRRVVSVTDIGGNKTYTLYDWLGRVSSVHYQPLKKNNTETLLIPAYDGFSRIKYIDYGSGMHRTLRYDAWGHKQQITDTQGKQLISQWKIAYDINDNIIMLTQKAEKEQYGRLHYQYDVLDNLVSMHCQGSSGLPLCPHDTSLTGSKLTQAPVITQQHYTFTPLNRLASVEEKLQTIRQKQTIRKIINYLYTNSSVPLRLQHISTMWNQNKPVLQNFSYDDVGNMTVDGENNHITYNALNEVTRVISSTGKQSDYSYDGSGQKVMEKSPNDISYLFYRGGVLMNEKIISAGQNTHITGYLGMAKTTDGMISEYYESSYKGDITGIFKKKDNRQYKLYQRNIYSPYGMIWHKTSKAVSLYQQTLQGFDGERTDPATGWQFLGAGNRTYNPSQRYFLSEDPAGDSYTFGSNNPIMNTDPSGNSPQWLGDIFKWTSYISTLGLSALHQRWANITASVFQAGLTMVTMGAAVASAGTAALAGVVAGTATVGSIPVVAAALPANKGLNIAASIIGMTEMAATIAVGGFLPFTATEEAITTDNEMVKLPFTMFSTRTASITDRATTPPPAKIDELLSAVSSLPAPPASTTVSEALEDLPCYHYNGSNPCLQFASLHAVSDAWLLLRSASFKDNIACDTGTILVAYFLANKPLPVNVLENFLQVREQYPCCFANLADANNTAYLTALKRALHPLTAYHARYHARTYTFSRLYKLFQSSDYIIISSYKHITILNKIKAGSGSSSIYNLYEFSDYTGITILNTSNAGIAEQFTNPITQQAFISGYMSIRI